jgi:hypothetical protein
MTIFNPISESQFLVTFSKFGTFLFTEKDGGDVEAETSEYANGSGMEIHRLTGPRKVSPITLKAPFDPRLQAYLDPIILSWSCETGSITITPVGCEGTINSTPGGVLKPIPGLLTGVTPAQINDSYTYTGVRISKYTTPKVDRKSANAAMIELEFIANSMIRGGTYNPGNSANGQANDSGNSLLSIATGR